MSNKGLIRFLAVLLAFACIWHLSFSVRTSMIKKSAEDYAAGDPVKESQFWDSINKKESVYFWYTYKECLENELNFGLDLKGGMNVILEVSVADVVDALSGHSQDTTYRAALKDAKEMLKDSQDDFITLFGKAFEKRSTGKLASIFATSPSLKDKLSFKSSNDEVLKVLADECESAVDNSFNVLRTRIDRFGVTQPNIQKLSGQTGRILVELPGVKDPERVKNLLQGTANLEFWETFDYSEVIRNFQRADQKVKSLIDAGYDFKTNEYKNAVAADSTEQGSLLGDVAAADSASLMNASRDQLEKTNPLFAVLTPSPYQSGACIGLAKDTAKVNEYLACPQVRDMIRRDLKNDIKLFWSKKETDFKPQDNPTRFAGYFELVAIKVTTPKGLPVLSGDVVTDAREEFDERKGGAAQVSMTMNGEGTREWARITHDNLKRQVAIVLDNLVYSYPTVQSEITGGNSQITGNFTLQEAKDLANILKSGKLPAPAHIIENEVVGPSLGQATINQGLWSFVGAFIIVILYMIYYYRTAGVASAIALVCNLFFLIGVLASLGAVLTLPGIAGIVLTMGMAVDANVIIYERIREELHSGKGLKLAIQDGYSNSYSAILDGNTTTLLTGIILYIFGHGPIQGFATTLVIGIITTLLTAIFVTRLFFEYRLNKNKEIKFWGENNEYFLKNTKINFLDMKQKYYYISGAIILASIISMATVGFDKGVDFVGGRTYVVRFDKSVSSNDIASKLEAAFDNDMPQVKTYGSDNQVKIVTKYRIDDDSDGVDSQIESSLYDNLVSLFNVQGVSRDMFLQGFIIEDGKASMSDDDKIMHFGLQSSSKVGPTIADDIKISAVWAILISLIVMFLYILLRFKNWQYGLGATAALIHDTIIVLGMFSILKSIMPFSMEVDQSFIAAILTIVGYSINDTVVVFDRVREFIGLHPKTDLKQNMNDAINSTLSRTVNTSLTTIFVLLVIFIFGGEVIRGFVFGLLLGTIVGTYSSVFIASPIAFDFLKKDKSLESADVK